MLKAAALFWGLLFYVLATPGAAAFSPHPRLGCVAGYKPAVVMSPVGVQTIHRWSSISAITIFLPLPAGQEAVRDLNSIGYHEDYPERFTISEGTLGTAFIRVDQRRGGRLDRCLTELTERFSSQTKDRLALIDAMKTFVAEELDFAPPDFHPAVDHDPPPVGSIPSYASAAGLAPGHPPLATSLRHPSIPLEVFLAEQKGACLPKAILTSLLMRRLGEPNALRTGGTETSGHSWIELPDGRHLDPTWQELGPVTSTGALPGWFHFSRSFLFQNQYYPITVEAR